MASFAAIGGFATLLALPSVAPAADGDVTFVYRDGEVGPSRVLLPRGPRPALRKTSRDGDVDQRCDGVCHVVWCL